MAKKYSPGKVYASVGLVIPNKNKQEPDSILQSIYRKYPAFKNMGPITMKADPNFTTDKTGTGDIEYFSPEQGRDTITYPNNFKYSHPKPGTHGIVYNPKTNNEQNIMLDMLHGMTSDPVYAKHREEFSQSFLNKYKNDAEYEWNNYDKETGGNNDGKDSFMQNWIDGQIRGLMFEGSPEDFKKQRYWEGARSQYLSDPEISKRFTQLQNYLKTGKGYTLPEVEIKPKAANGLSMGKAKSDVKWKIVKDLSGYPSHADGGVDIRIDPTGAYFKHSSGKEIKAADGLYVDGWDELKATINPKNWGVTDLSDKPDFSSAYTAARQQGMVSFMYKNKRYNTKYAGTKEEQLKETGILNEQMVNRSEAQNRLAKNVVPFSYDDQAKRVWKAVVLNETDPARTVMNRQIDDNDATAEDFQKRLDAYNMYMGIPQKHNTFGISKSKPTKSENPNATYYKINNPSLYKTLAENYPKEGVQEDIGSRVMGNFTVGYGQDEKGKYVSYYDKWDLEPVDYGKPFEMYDRVYYREVPAGKDINNRPVTKRVLSHYGDSELLALDPENQSADTYLLQQELSNLGYKLPKSTLKEGKKLDSGYYTNFDGIYGPETKQALIDWQTKNRK